MRAAKRGANGERVLVEWGANGERALIEWGANGERVLGGGANGAKDMEGANDEL